MIVRIEPHGRRHDTTIATSHHQRPTSGLEPRRRRLEKWDRFFDEQKASLDHLLVAEARLPPSMRVLDPGSDTGYPAILAAQTVGPSGSVAGIDLAEQMPVVAERKAKRLGLANIAFRTGDVTTLPFETQTFDAVTSRFCLMFLP